ncbi:MAG: DUF309 domain-containing protein [Thermoplasmata archaeon]
MGDGSVEDPNHSNRLHRALVEGVNLYNGGNFFECHEVLEQVWLEVKEDDKMFLQGIIKIAAAFHHFRKGTFRGMLDLLIAGKGTLEGFEPCYRGVELEEFLKGVDLWIPRARKLLQGGRLDEEAEIPPLRYAQVESDRHWSGVYRQR